MMHGLYWFRGLLDHMHKGEWTEEQWQAIIAMNWHRTVKDFEREGVLMPGCCA